MLLLLAVRAVVVLALLCLCCHGRSLALRSVLRKQRSAAGVATPLYLSSSGGAAGEGFGGGSKIRKPTILTPSTGSVNKGLEKFMMMYTCKICTGRNAQMVSKVAYNHGMVVSTCRHCKNKHLIADNEGKLDMGQYGKKIEEFLQDKGEKIQRLTLSPADLEDYYLIDEDGEIKLVPKMGGQPSADSTIVEYPTNKPA